MDLDELLIMARRGLVTVKAEGDTLAVTPRGRVEHVRMTVTMIDRKEG